MGRGKEIEDQKGWMRLGMSTARNEKADPRGARDGKVAGKFPTSIESRRLKCSQSFCNAISLNGTKLIKRGKGGRF